MAIGKLPGSLEGMLGCALNSNPDILVAEADLHHAQAKVNQIRLQVSHALVEVFQQRKLAQQVLDRAKDKYVRTQALSEKGLVDSEALACERYALTLAEAELSGIESMIRSLIGQAPTSPETPETLAKALTLAFQSNGEIGLVRADLVRMDARSNQVRLKVMKEVTLTFQERRSRLNALDIAVKIYQQTQEQVAKGLVSEEERLAVFQSMIETEVALGRVEAHLNYLLGLAGVGKSQKKD